MTDISFYFEALKPELTKKRYTLDQSKLRDYTDFHLEGDYPNWRKADVVILGCNEDRGAREGQGAGLAPDAVREHLYHLVVPKAGMKIADLGNLKKMEDLSLYYDALSQVVEEVVKLGKLLIILGGSQDIVYGQYKGYQRISTNVEYVHIDSTLDVEDSDFGVNNKSINHKIFLHSPNFLFNFTNLGYQSYFVSPSDKKRLQNLYFHALRVGELKNKIHLAEPYLRNANLVSVDMAAVRSADAPGTSHPSPAGFSSDEICQLMRFAGMSNRVSSLSLTELQPERDTNEQAVLLGALMLWYFIEGYYNRRPDEPSEQLDSLTKYTVSIHNGAQEISFYHNTQSDRWWMEVPYSDDLGKKEGRSELIPCSPADYESAKEDEIPERWWQAHHKLR